MDLRVFCCLRMRGILGPGGRISKRNAQRKAKKTPAQAGALLADFMC
jgi:hypothetical protein